MFTPGTILAGKYELIEVAGQGGMASVWRARSRGAGGFSRSLAIKVMLPRLCNDPHFVELFVEEARVSSQLQHPNVVQISDFGEQGGVYFLVMEWVDGLDLLDYTRSFTEQGYYMPWAVLAIVAVEVLKGMHAAHLHRDERGHPCPIFHRDVTPHNILLGVNGVVKLTDFGLAKATDRGTLTLPHVLKGKISYTAPEMTRGVRANARTDIFSLGVTLWEALTGRKMFDAVSPLQVVKQIQAWSIPPLRDLRPDLPAELVQIVERAIARDPEQRFVSAQDFALALSTMLPPLPDMQRFGKSIEDARARIKRSRQGENLDDLKVAMRPARAPAPAFRAAAPEQRAARAPRPAPPGVAPPAPAAPARSPSQVTPPKRRPSSPPPALTRSVPPVSIPIPSSLPPVRISEQPSSVSVVLDDFSEETGAPVPPPPAPLPSHPSLHLSITFEDQAPTTRPSPPAAKDPSAAPTPAPAPPAAPALRPGASPAAPRPVQPRPAAPASPRSAVGAAPAPAGPKPPAMTPRPAPVAPTPAPTLLRAAPPAPVAPAPAASAPPTPRPRPGRMEEPSPLDFSIELELPPSMNSPAPGTKKE
jgi:serine/threonine-protein kinase